MIYDLLRKHGTMSFSLFLDLEWMTRQGNPVGLTGVLTPEGQQVYEILFDTNAPLVWHQEVTSFLREMTE